MNNQFSSDFRSLAEIGKITREVHWCGHSFVLKSLSTAEELAIAKVTSSYKGSLGEQRATVAAAVAISLESINGVPFFPIVMDSDVEKNLRVRFNTVIEWSYLLIDFLFGEQTEVTRSASEAVEELKKKSESLTPGSSLGDIAEALRREASSQEVT